MRETDRRKIWIGALILLIVLILSFLTPWSEWGALGKQIVFPFLAGILCVVLFSNHFFFRVICTLVSVLGIGLFSAVHSNGYDWRMDDEWSLVLVSLGSQFLFFLFGMGAVVLWKELSASEGTQESAG